MNTLTLVLSALVALEHFYILFLETFATGSAATARTFSIPRRELRTKPVSTLFKNQGVYNGLLAVLIIVALVTGNVLWLRLLLGYVVLVALCGGVTARLSILFTQGVPALLALGASLLL